MNKTFYSIHHRLRIVSAAFVIAFWACWLMGAQSWAFAPGLMSVFFCILFLWAAFGEERITSYRNELICRYHFLGVGILSETRIKKTAIAHVAIETVESPGRAGKKWHRLAVQFFSNDRKIWQTKTDMSQKAAEGLLKFIQSERGRT